MVIYLTLIIIANYKYTHTHAHLYSQSMQLRYENLISHRKEYACMDSGIRIC